MYYSQDPAQGNEASAALAATRPYDMQQNGPDQERAAVATPLGCRQAEVCPYIRPALVRQHYHLAKRKIRCALSITVLEIDYHSARTNSRRQRNSQHTGNRLDHSGSPVPSLVSKI